MSEAATLAAIRLALGTNLNLRMFRNNVGVLHDRNGRPVRFGLFPGSSDLIGWRTVTVTQDMVGKNLAVFAAIEVKTQTGRPTIEQSQFLNAVMAAGGFADVARSPEQALAALGIPA